jgi:hypothetical protein
MGNWPIGLDVQLRWNAPLSYEVENALTSVMNPQSTAVFLLTWAFRQVFLLLSFCRAGVMRKRLATECQERLFAKTFADRNISPVG